MIPFGTKKNFVKFSLKTSEHTNLRTLGFTHRPHENQELECYLLNKNYYEDKLQEILPHHLIFKTKLDRFGCIWDTLSITIKEREDFIPKYYMEIRNVLGKRLKYPHITVTGTYNLGGDGNMKELLNIMKSFDLILHKSIVEERINVIKSLNSYTNTDSGPWGKQILGLLGLKKHNVFRGKLTGGEQRII